MRHVWLVSGMAAGLGLMVGLSAGQTQPAKVAAPTRRAPATGTGGLATSQAATGVRTTGAGATGPAASEAAVAVGGAAAMPQSLEADIKDCIALLEAGKNRELIEKLAEPAMVQKAKTTGEFDQLVASFGGPRAAKLLVVLKAALEQVPVVTEDGTAAVFPTMADSPKLEFHLIAGSWRLK